MAMNGNEHRQFMIDAIFRVSLTYCTCNHNECELFGCYQRMNTMQSKVGKTDMNRSAPVATIYFFPFLFFSFFSKRKERTELLALKGISFPKNASFSS